GDDPEMVLHAVRLAVGYRQTFHTDIVLDLFCYRRHGHNETDEPGFTQPLTYKVIKNHPSSLEVYIRKLEEEGALKPGEAEEIRAGYNDLMNNALEATRRDNIKSIPETLSGRWSGLERGLMPKGIVTTEVTINCLLSVSEKASSVPDGFTHHPRLARLLKARKDMVEDRQPIDWGMGELLTYGSLLQEGFNVRLSGQDVKRGTFSHRHVNLVDVENGKDYIALQHLKEKQGRFEVHDSPLSEAGVLGFEFGYSLADPFCLTVWEAQFGDFANGAQVIIDQFIASSESKWLRMSGLVMLLPHGFEGQGPEHSSARMERYLQMCGEHNIQVCNVTTPAQFFHMMRRQMHRKFRKPLIVMSPKSLLRHPQAVSTTEDFIRGSFREMLYDKGDLDKKKVRRLAVCTGKVFYDLSAARDENGVKDVALARMEQVYPFPAEDLKDILSQYPALKEVVWVQEEPRNMGSWDFLEPRLREILGKKLTLEYVGRKPSSSPATGSNRAHQEEQKTLVAYALGIKAGSNSKKQG
ncbi:MAG: thiamine pyrophosphate-dependent enzyme, partial [Deltaproteobacteria bacterium]|nr:thiamine pyrophosphate-dependent enzyme [Deltaproteobacteria bacterium]